MSGKRIPQIGGVLSGIVLIAFGIGAIVLSFNGRSTVNSSLKEEQITGSPDMTPDAIAGEVSAAKAAQSRVMSELQAAGVTIKPSPIIVLAFGAMRESPAGKAEPVAATSSA